MNSKQKKTFRMSKNISDALELYSAKTSKSQTDIIEQSLDLYFKVHNVDGVVDVINQHLLSSIETIVDKKMIQLKSEVQETKENNNIVIELLQEIGGFDDAVIKKKRLKAKGLNFDF